MLAKSVCVLTPTDVDRTVVIKVSYKKLVSMFFRNLFCLQENSQPDLKTKSCFLKAVFHCTEARSAVFQFCSKACKCELISETRKTLITLNHCHRLITLNGSLPKCFPLFKATIKWSLASPVFNNNPFEIVRISWNQSNPNHDVKISKVQSNSAVSNMGYNESLPCQTVFHSEIPFDVICLNKRSEITNPDYIEPISVSLECSV